jgi:serine/threonine protein kinase/Tol biopolymer transport system component
LIGETVSHYRILSKLGGGGMGVVYEAEDPRLGRNVAVKFLPEDTAQSPEALERFKREARAASALNHPHICTIHDIGEHERRPFIVMERMKGQTLKHRIAGRRMPLEQVLELGVQIADALEAAHGARIVHRDLKPANVFVTDHGEAKLLDFGLAKLTGWEKEGPGSEAQTEARDTDLTRPGLTLGTVAYMSPEQARGDDVDARSDLFSLGVVLYEMATGRLPFAGKTSAEVFNGILSHPPPPPSGLNAGIPPKLAEIILKALEKDRETRYQTAADLRADLKRLKRGSESAISGFQTVPGGSAVHGISGRRGRAWPLAVVAVTVTLLGVVALLVRRPGVARPFLAAARFSQLTDQPGLETSPSLSPDAKSLVYASRISGNWDIYLQRVDGKKAINLTADALEDDTQPEFSPDGALVAFRSERNGGGLFTMGATGESVRRISSFGYDPAWSPDGKRVVCATERVDDPKHRWSTSTLWVIDVASGAKRQLATTDAVQPDWSPQGFRIAYWMMAPSGQRDLWTIPADGGPATAVTDDPPLDWDPVWSRDGDCLFFISDRGGSMNLWRVPVNEKTGKVRGAPEPVTTPSSDAGFMSFSGDGSTLAYVARAFSRNISRLAFDPDTDQAGDTPSLVTKGSLSVRDLDVSPDGSWLAYNSESTEKLFVVRTDGTGSRQLTEGASKDRGPRWSPDGSRIAFYSNRTGAYQIWTIKPDGSELQQVTEDTSTSGLLFPVWSRDGRFIVCSSFERKAFVVDVTKPWRMQTPAELPALPQPEDSFMAWAWSPGGKWLSGWQLRADGASTGVVIYDSTSRSYRIVTDFGTFPAWSADERRLTFSGRHTRFVVDLQTGKLKELGKAGDFEEEFALSSDRRWIYTVETQREGDVWIASLLRPETRR